MNGANGALQATAIFALVLAFSLLIERLLEVLKSFYDWLDSHFDWYHLWTRRAYGVKTFVERRRRLFQFIPPLAQAAFLARLSEVLLQKPGGGCGPIPVVSGDLVRQVHVRVAAKLLGMTIGIALAHWQQLDLLSMYHEVASGTIKWGLDQVPGGWLPGLGKTVTGIAIGLGSGPVHKIITTLERKRDEMTGVSAAVKSS
ncbi:MAG TPA: hypothetical protein VH438_00085 [Gemmatimonadales bacterium]|jgi:hypothetical protein